MLSHSRGTSTFLARLLGAKETLFLVGKPVKKHVKFSPGRVSCGHGMPGPGCHCRQGGWVLGQSPGSEGYHACMISVSGDHLFLNLYIYICMNIIVTLKDHYMDIIMNAMLTYK